MPENDLFKFRILLSSKYTSSFIAKVLTDNLFKIWRNNYADLAMGYIYINNCFKSCHKVKKIRLSLPDKLPTKQFAFRTLSWFHAKLPACRRLLFPLLHAEKVFFPRATKEIGDVCTQANAKRSFKVELRAHDQFSRASYFKKNT